MTRIARLRSVLIYLVLAVVLAITLPLTWLRWESHLPRDEWFGERQGQIESVATRQSITVYGQLSESVQLISNSGLQVSFRIIRNEEHDAPLPVLVVLGGHRTGSDAVDLFGDVGDRAVIGVDYPYHGPEKVKGVMPIVKTVPLARHAFLDITPAISLIIDWLVDQAWVDQNRMVVIGASLGVPFAAAAAARDKRITGIMLVHGAADNRLWFQVQVARRIDAKFLHYPLATVLNWLAYGPIFDTNKHIATVSPRPVLVIGARHDERTPAGQTESLFNAAHNPKRLRWTEGQHIRPDRNEVIEELLRIAAEELPFLTQ